MASEQDKRRAPVPKFSSFKPPAPASASHEPRPRHSSDAEAEAHSKRSGSHGRIADHGEHRPRGRDRNRNRERRLDRSPNRSHERKVAKTEPSPVAQIVQPGEDDILPYKVDKVGDKNNLVYGSLNRYDVPLYRREGRGRVLGLSVSHRIDRDSEDGKSLAVRPEPRAAEGERAKNRKALWKLAAKETRFHRIRPDRHSQPDLDLQRDYLPINHRGSNKRMRVHGYMSPHLLHHSSDEEGLDYRSIEGQAKGGVDADTPSSSELDSDNEIARKQNAELSNELSESQHDLDAWFRLIDHQENLVGRVHSDGHRILTAAEKRSVADMRISLYEKALGKIPPAAARDRLLVGMMEEGAKIWDTKTLSNKWKEILRLNPGYISLWVKYLNFQQTQFLTFTYDQCKSFFIECLKLNPQHDNANRKPVIDLYIALRLSLFMREAGFTEYAISLWQTVLEFNFCQPNNVDPSTATSSFSEFWESELPRIGELDAKGWDNADGLAVPSKSDPSVEDDIDKEAIFGSWVQQEQTCANQSSMPARTLDEVREDDPHRVILFSDVADFCIPFSRQGLSSLLINSFLIFCRLPPLASQTDAEIVLPWCRDPFICNSLLDKPTGLLSNLFFDTLQDPDAEIQNSPLSFSPHNFATTTSTLFGDKEHWFSALETWKETHSHNGAPIDSQWVRRSLQQLADRMTDMEELAEYAVALEFVCSPKEARKYAKRLLRKRPSSVRLYNAYALIEARSGQISSAEQVWSTTLTMNQDLGEDSRISCIALWRCWAWEALESNEPRKAMRLLICMSNQSLERQELLKNLETTAPVSAAESLKAERFLRDVQAQGLSLRKSDIFTDSTECLALLAYLFHDREIESALEIYKTASTQLEEHRLDQSITAELLHQARAKLLYYHARSNRLYKPATTRHELIDSISRFPSNTIFLTLFAWNESRYRIADRVRSVLREHTTQGAGNSGSTESLVSSSLIPHLFSIYTELHRGVSAGSTIHSARAAFEAAAASDSGKSSAALWKLYVLFELRFGGKDRSKDVFYRAIRACPWAKELVLLAFKEDGLRNNMQMNELRKVWNVLVEKELRIHIDLEQWIEEHEDELQLSDVEGFKEKQMPVDHSSDSEKMDPE